MTMPPDGGMVGSVQALGKAGSMDEELETIRESAKAIQEASKSGRAVVDAASDLGKWAAKVLGTVPEDLVGFSFGDYFREVRIRNMDRMRRKTDEILQRRGVKEPLSIGPKHAIPLFEAVGEESDETLQDLWARLLANAMDPNHEVQLQRVFIDTLRQFESFDALVFDKLATIGRSQAHAEGMAQAMSGNVRSGLIQVSLDHLVGLRCVVVFDASRYQLAALGWELRYAIGSNG